jgi:ribosomal protein S18 acetylase RimI-like enzyme
MSGGSTAELLLREPVAGDAPAVAALVNRHAAALGLPPDADAEQTAAWWSGDAVTALVAEAEGTVVGCGWLLPQGEQARLDVTGEAALAPLLAELEARAAARARVVRAVLHERDPAGDVFAARGYRAIRASYDMEIALEPPPAPPSWPEGVTARTARPGDEPVFWRVQEEAFADHWGYHRRSYEEWSHLYGTVRPLDPELWLLAEQGAEPVGVAICERGVEGDEEAGWIHVVAVRRPWRGRGVGHALLSWSFGALAAVGMRRAALSVDAENTTGAVRLYERAGMRVSERFAYWEKEL